jgi:sarcosine oxidase subunit beta
VRIPIVVVGGGVWGVTAAVAAAERRPGAVWLLEANIGVARESSAKSGGIVTDLLWHPEDQAFVTRSRTWYERAATRSGDPTLIRRAGMLTLAEGELTAALLRRELDLSRRSVPYELLDRPTIQARFPYLDRLGPNVTALWTPDDWFVNPTAYAETMLRLGREAGLTVRTGFRVERVQVEEHRVVLEGQGETLEAERVLIAAGTWTRKLVRTAGLDIPLRPYRVQLSSLEFPTAHGLPIVWDLATDVYVVPDGERNVMAGDGTQLTEFDPDAYRQTGDSEFIAAVAERLTQLTSLGDQAGLRSSWAGLAGGTPDRRPLIGPLTDRLVVATGDQGIGVMRGPALGELAAHVLLGEADVPHLAPQRVPVSDFPIRAGFTLD